MSWLNGSLQTQEDGAAHKLSGTPVLDQPGIEEEKEKKRKLRTQDAYLILGYAALAGAAG